MTIDQIIVLLLLANLTLNAILLGRMERRLSRLEDIQKGLYRA